VLKKYVRKYFMYKIYILLNSVWIWTISTVTQYNYIDRRTALGTVSIGGKKERKKMIQFPIIANVPIDHANW